MKRTLLVVAVLATATAVYCGSRLGAQAPAQVRVGFVNVARVFQDYHKAQFYKTELEKLIEPKKKERDKLISEINFWKKTMAEDAKLKKGDPTFDASLYERYERGIVNNQRRLEDLEKELRQTIGERSEQQNVQLYKELYDAAQRVGADRHFHLVMAYVEPTTGDPFNLVNIMRKVQGMDMGGCVTALYIAPGLDLSATIVDELNRAYRAAGGIVPVIPASLPKKN